MIIADLQGRSKALLGRIPPEVFTILILIFSVSGAFGLGLLAGRDLGQKGGGDDQFWIEKLPVEARAQSAAVVEAAPAPIETPTTGTYMASKNGTKYYLPTCGSAKRIKAENRIWFETKEEAEAAGYGPAANCPGL